MGNGSAQARGGQQQQQQQWQQSSSSSSGSSGIQTNSTTYYSLLEEQINLQAKRQTSDYLKQNAGGDDNQDKEKVFIVYKFVNTPIEALIAGM